MKRIYYLLFILMSFSLLSTNVYAATASVKVSSSTVTAGKKVTITTTISSNKTIFFIEGTLSCGGAGVNKNQSLVFDNNSNNVYSKSYSLTVSPTTTGTITCVTKGVKVIDASKNEWQSVSNKTAYVTVRTTSSNSYLSSLSIEGYELDSAFNKDVFEYSVTVKEGTESVKINAKAADSYAGISGTGTVSVSEGVNDISIIVTAENGSKRTYKLKVTVKEFAPIKVNVNGTEYSVVRKRKNLPKVSEYFKEKDITISEELIEGYYSEDLDYTLVGLKDSAGKVSYYIYDNDKYTLYNEQVFNGMTLRIIDKELPNGYVKKSFTHNDTDIVGYQEVKMDIIKNTYALSDNEIEGNNFYLFYAINLDTKKEELYQYDALEKTVQRYNTLILDMHKDISNKYYLYLIYCIIALVGTVILFSILLALKGRKKSELKRFEEEGLL